MSILSYLNETSDFLLITINVHPSSSKKEIVATKFSFDIYVNEPPDKGKANKAIIKLISKVFQISSSDIKIVRGIKTKKKTISIPVQHSTDFKLKLDEMLS